MSKAASGGPAKAREHAVGGKLEDIAAGSTRRFLQEGRCVNQVAALPLLKKKAAEVYSPGPVPAPSEVSTGGAGPLVKLWEEGAKRECRDRYGADAFDGSGGNGH